MSHFTTVRTQFTDPTALVKALDDAGYKKVEVHNQAQNLYGYQGDVRAQTAEIIVRRNYVGRASNDLGFKRQNDATFEAIISEYDSRRHNEAWLQRLSQRYAYHVATAKLAEQGFNLVTEETQADGRIHLVARRIS